VSVCVDRESPFPPLTHSYFLHSLPPRLFFSGTRGMRHRELRRACVCAPPCHFQIGSAKTSTTTSATHCTPPLSQSRRGEQASGVSAATAASSASPELRAAVAKLARAPLLLLLLARKLRRALWILRPSSDGPLGHHRRRCAAASSAAAAALAAGMIRNSNRTCCGVFWCGIAWGACRCPRLRRPLSRRRATAAASSLPCSVSLTGGARLSARDPLPVRVAGPQVGWQPGCGNGPSCPAGPARVGEKFCFILVILNVCFELKLCKFISPVLEIQMIWFKMCCALCEV
jgi:hypothetical protein